ncbi:MAG TPA: histidine kinase [Chitinophagaceae bacterium]|nr:histidine kinase [Chitinophagaceae bacterium]
MNTRTQAAVKQNPLIKYKLYHIPFWLLYNYTWWAVQSRNPVVIMHDAFFSPYTIKFLFYVIFQAAAAYFNLYFLMPRFLEKGKYIQYIVYLLLSIFCAASLIVPGYYISSVVSGISFRQLFGGDFDFWSMLVTNPLQTTVASTTLAMSIKLTKSWIASRRRQQLLEKENLETELKFLKYQFNPHFLFNSINSIFFLIHKNPDAASSSLAKFSDLLRHQLYECNDNQVPLSKEITYLENFIELEKLRQNNNIQVQFTVNTNQTGHVLIAPFVLMTFVENAFKHVSRHADKPNTIRIQLEVKRTELLLTVENTSSAPGMNKDVIHYGGIGLQNVRRRLDLIYGGNYTLSIHDSGSSFEVKLALHLVERVMTQTREPEDVVMFAGA